ncbi:hypothetical protein IQ06DRAFT_101689 [Phaeosphaeriaceae sp. SRC1lsM3a]|nr:hypothetical protein IQ06DRAFT_101689 [Stagonospora sp. SRC1lsM3a]
MHTHSHESQVSHPSSLATRVSFSMVRTRTRRYLSISVPATIMKFPNGYKFSCPRFSTLQAKASPSSTFHQLRPHDDGRDSVLSSPATSNMRACQSSGTKVCYQLSSNEHSRTWSSPCFPNLHRSRTRQSVRHLPVMANHCSVLATRSKPFIDSPARLYRRARHCSPAIRIRQPL